MELVGKKRRVSAQKQLTQVLAKPNGYHYWGTPSEIFQGAPTVLLRPPRQGAQTQAEFYRDCYCPGFP
jgi:hypothetical protein